MKIVPTATEIRLGQPSGILTFNPGLSNYLESVLDINVIIIHIVMILGSVTLIDSGIYEIARCIVYEALPIS